MGDLSGVESLELSLRFLDIELGIVVDEGGKEVSLLDGLTLENVDVFHDAVEEGGDDRDIGIGFDPAGGLEEEGLVSGDRDIWGWSGRVGPTDGVSEGDDGGDANFESREEAAAEHEGKDSNECEQEADREERGGHTPAARAVRGSGFRSLEGAKLVERHVVLG